MTRKKYGEQLHSILRLLIHEKSGAGKRKKNAWNSNFCWLLIIFRMYQKNFENNNRMGWKSSFFIFKF